MEGPGNDPTKCMESHKDISLCYLLVESINQISINELIYKTEADAQTYKKKKTCFNQQGSLGW